jgi:hypothetical protein
LFLKRAKAAQGFPRDQQSRMTECEEGAN